MIGMESLFNLCLEFLAKNISSLESLVGFPEIVGEQLATQVAVVFEKTNSSPDIKFAKVIILFVNAYGSSAVSSLNLSDCKTLRYSAAMGDIHFKLNAEAREALFSIVQSSALTELDLSHGTICKKQDWLDMIGQCRLKVLRLKNTGLSSTDIISLSRCASIRKSGLYYLTRLDISDNGIGRPVLSRMKSFPSLEYLDISNTFIQKSDVDTEYWSFHDASLREALFCVTDTGWFSSTIRILSQDSTTQSNKSKSFYGKEPCSLQSLNNMSAGEQKPTSPKKLVSKGLLLLKRRLSIKESISCKPSTVSLKRQLSSNTNRNNKRPKRQSSEDTVCNILDMYS